MEKKEAFELVRAWFVQLEQTGSAANIPVDAFAIVFHEAGAVQFTRSIRSLSKGTNEGQAPGMRLVWGRKFAEFKNFVKAFVANYEADVDRLPKGNLKSSSAIKLLGLLTAVYSGVLTQSEVQPYLEAMVRNGLDWKNGRKKKEDRIYLPILNSDDKTPHPVPVLPAGFPAKLYELLEQWAGFHLE